LISTKSGLKNGKKISIYGKLHSAFLVKLYTLLEEGIGQRGTELRCVGKRERSAWEILR